MQTTSELFQFSIIPQRTPEVLFLPNCELKPFSTLQMASTQPNDNNSMNANNVYNTQPTISPENSNFDDCDTIPMGPDAEGDASSLENGDNDDKFECDMPDNSAMTATNFQMFNSYCPAIPKSMPEFKEEFTKYMLEQFGDESRTKSLTRAGYQKIVAALLGLTNDAKSLARAKERCYLLGNEYGPVTLEEIRNIKLDDAVLWTYKINRGETTASSVANDAAPTAASVNTVNEIRRVVWVEQFFDIITYCHQDGRRYNGQKKVFKTICEKYAALPRDAVYYYLRQCPHCPRGLGAQMAQRAQKRMLTMQANSSATSAQPMLAITAGNLKKESPQPAPVMMPYEKMFSGISMVPRKKILIAPMPAASQQQSQGNSSMKASPAPVIKSEYLSAALSCGYDASTSGSDSMPAYKKLSNPILPTQMNGNNNNSGPFLCFLPGNNVGKSATCGMDESSVVSGSSLNLFTDQDALGLSSMAASEYDDNEQEDDDLPMTLESGAIIDIDRYKAFNMFVRVLVDKLLDRNIPIAQQPKEKVDLIHESVCRQFPDFGLRSRHRIRTYLKQCRRTSRRHGGATIECRKPAYLTSPAAEKMVEQAFKCEAPILEKLLPMDGNSSINFSQYDDSPFFLTPENFSLPPMAVDDDDASSSNSISLQDGMTLFKPLTTVNHFTAKSTSISTSNSTHNHAIRFQSNNSTSGAHKTYSASNTQHSIANNFFPQGLPMNMATALQLMLQSGDVKTGSTGSVPKLNNNGTGNDAEENVRIFIASCRMVATFLYMVAQTWEGMTNSATATASQPTATSNVTLPEENEVTSVPTTDKLCNGVVLNYETIDNLEQTEEVNINDTAK